MEGEWGEEKGVMGSQSNLHFLFKSFCEYICKMMDENNLIHSTDLYLGYALCKEKYAVGVVQEDYEAKKQKAIALLSLS